MPPLFNEPKHTLRTSVIAMTLAVIGQRTVITVHRRNEEALPMKVLQCNQQYENLEWKI